jgi:uncharacterized protein (DUF58 family)
LKQDLIVEICALLSFSALHNNDQVSVIFFTDRIEKFIPPVKGVAHVLRIIRDLLNFNPASLKTDLSGALHFLNGIMKHKSIVFVLSDFMSSQYEHALHIASKKHDVICVRIYDRKERELPNLGIITLSDAETGQQVPFDSSGRKSREAYTKQFDVYSRYFTKAYRRSGADAVSISTTDDYIKSLLQLFKRRATRA